MLWPRNGDNKKARAITARAVEQGGLAGLPDRHRIGDPRPRRNSAVCGVLNAEGDIYARQASAFCQRPDVLPRDANLRR